MSCLRSSEGPTKEPGFTPGSPVLADRYFFSPRTFCPGGQNLTRSRKCVRIQYFEEGRFESHKDYLDIQYIAEGYESFGQALVCDCKLNESVPDNDVYFYDTPEFYTQVNLKAGDLVVVPPEEVHQPRVCYHGKKMMVTKVVVKVKV